MVAVERKKSETAVPKLTVVGQSIAPPLVINDVQKQTRKHGGHDACATTPERIKAPGGRSKCVPTSTFVAEMKATF